MQALADTFAAIADSKDSALLEDGDGQLTELKEDIAKTVEYLMKLELKRFDLDGNKQLTNLYRELTCNRESLIPAAKWAYNKRFDLPEKYRESLDIDIDTFLHAAQILVTFRTAMTNSDDNLKLDLEEFVRTLRVDANGKEVSPSSAGFELREAFRLAWIYSEMKEKIEYRIEQRALLGKQLRTVSVDMAEYRMGERFPLLVGALTKHTSVVSILCDLCWDLMLLVKFRICRKIEDRCIECVGVEWNMKTRQYREVNKLTGGSKPERVGISCLCDNGWVKCEPQVCPKGIQDLCQNVFDCVKDRNSMDCYDVENSLNDLSRLQDRVMVTFLRGAKLAPLDQLKCCINWNRDDLAKKFVLSAMPIDENEKLTDAALCEAFKMALINGAHKLIIPLFDAIQDKGRFDALELYIDKLAEMREEASFCKGLQTAFFNKHFADDKELSFENVLQWRAMRSLVNQLKSRFHVDGDVSGEHWRSEVAAMADRLDPDKDGSVTAPELADEMVNTLGFKPTKKELDATIRALDATDDTPAPRRLSVAETVSIKGQGLFKKIGEALKWPRHSGKGEKGAPISKDRGDGTLSPEEFRQKVCGDEKLLESNWEIAKEKVRLGRDKLLFTMHLLDEDQFTVSGAYLKWAATTTEKSAHRDPRRATSKRFKFTDVIRQRGAVQGSVHKMWEAGADEDEAEAKTRKKRVAQPADELLYDLLVWAVLFNELTAAKIIWERCVYSIETALVAAGVCKYLFEHPRLLDLGPEEAVSLKAGWHEFQTISVGVLGQCYTSDPEDCTELLRCPLLRFPSTGDEVTTFADVAREQQLLTFLCHPSVQASGACMR